jgi:integrase
MATIKGRTGVGIPAGQLSTPVEEFDPDDEFVDGFVFVRHKGKPFDDASMATYISTAAHALTGQRLTPHLLRNIFATHFLDRGASDSDIASLAYGMSHSPQILRETYDRRSPAQKHRPIQAALLDLVQQSFHQD